MKLKSSFLLFMQAFLLINAEIISDVPLERELQITESSTDRTVPSDFFCNKEMMLSYGLLGNIKPSAVPHKYCPGIKSNCCTLQDADTSMYFWTTDSKLRVERYYEVFLYLIKYILGYSAEVSLLAKDFSTSSISTCKDAANDYMQMNLNPKLASVIYGTFADTVKSLGDLRRGFFCILCDAVTQKSLKDYWGIVNLAYSDRIYFSNDFCVKLVDQSIQSSYFLITFIQRFSNNLAKLINCKLGTKSSISYDLSFEKTQQIKNCFFFKNKYFFFFCEYYCSRFHLTKPSDLIDNEISELKKFFVLIRDNKDKVFYNPSNNILIGGFYVEKYVTENLDAVEKTKVFFPAAATHVMDLSTYETDVIYDGGMDPWDSVESSGYEMVISGELKLTAKVFLGILMFWLIK